MDYKKHFQDDDIIKFKISDGSEFGYKPMTAGEENDYLPEYIDEVTSIHPETGKPMVKRVENLSKLNKVKLYNLVEAPYPEWDKKTKEERWNMLRQLKPNIFSEIINTVNNLGSIKQDQKKNSLGELLSQQANQE